MVAVQDEAEPAERTAGWPGRSSTRSSVRVREEKRAAAQRRGEGADERNLSTSTRRSAVSAAALSDGERICRTERRVHAEVAACSTETSRQFIRAVPARRPGQIDVDIGRCVSGPTELDVTAGFRTVSTDATAPRTPRGGHPSGWRWVPSCARSLVRPPGLERATPRDQHPGLGRCADAAQRVLLRGPSALRLTPRTVDVLIALVGRHARSTGKEWLLGRVWRGHRRANLPTPALRRVLGDSARHRGSSAIPAAAVLPLPRRSPRGEAGRRRPVTAPAPALRKDDTRAGSGGPPAPRPLDGVSAPEPTTRPESPPATGRSRPCGSLRWRSRHSSVLALPWWMKRIAATPQAARGPRRRSRSRTDGRRAPGGLAEALTGSLVGALGRLDGVRAGGEPPGGIPTAIGRTAGAIRTGHIRRKGASSSSPSSSTRNGVARLGGRVRMSPVSGASRDGRSLTRSTRSSGRASTPFTDALRAGGSRRLDVSTLWRGST